MKAHLDGGPAHGKTIELANKINRIHVSMPDPWGEAFVDFPTGPHVYRLYDEKDGELFFDFSYSEGEHRYE